ncbi:hypothetical protein [Pontibacillus halophilus]|uniref:hypothetical protein n=1 Tax=Pontibacillus halophilus TaxID=516704 RepID=UPI0004198687|nr:hypothetical protein [Pontibacillus halophilus]
MEQFNLLGDFGMEEATEVSTTDKAKNNKKSSTTKPKDDSKSVGDKFEVKLDTIIRYAGVSHPIRAYFDELEIKEGIEKDGKRVTIAAEDVRERMEKELVIFDDNTTVGPYIELIKGYTDVVYNTERNIIIPLPISKKKGAKDLCMETANAVSFLRKRIPFELFLDFLRVAYHYSNHYGTEVKGDIFYNHESDEYELHIPHQAVSSVLVTDVQHSMDVFTGHHTLCMEIHSHHVLPCYPSATDDEDEQRPNIVYGIVGNFRNRFDSEVYLRVYKDNRFIKIPLSLVFCKPTSKQTANYSMLIGALKQGLEEDLAQVSIMRDKTNEGEWS